VPDERYKEAREFSEKEQADPAAINAWNRTALSMHSMPGSREHV
jgi:hypothetical protein